MGLSLDGEALFRVDLSAAFLSLCFESLRASLTESPTSLKRDGDQPVEHTAYTNHRLGGMESKKITFKFST